MGEKYDGYEAIIKSFGGTATCEWFGDYQGDIGVIITDGSSVGWLVIGYGSCSGCDAFEAVSPWCSHGDDPCDCNWSGVQELRDSLFSQIKWNEAPPEPNDPNEWWSFDGEVQSWIAAEYAKAVLTAGPTP